MDLSFVVVEYYSLDLLGGYLSSIESYVEDLNYEVVISSNSRYDPKKQRELVESAPPWVIWLFNNSNLGFAKAANKGFSKSRGRYVFLLNVDARIKEGSLKEVILFLDRNPQIAVLGPKIIDEDGRIQDSARAFMTPKLFFKRTWKRIKEGTKVVFDFELLEEPHPVDWVIGGAMLVRKATFDEVGGFDEKFFLYVEDMDFCLKIWRRGYKVFFWPQLTIQYSGTKKSLPLGVKGLARAVFNKYSWIHLINYLRFLRNYYRPGR
jgi:hypothetical protein